MMTNPVLVPTASLHGKVAIVTGAGRGIGKGVALELGSRGCSVVVNYAQSKASADEVVRAIESNGTGAKAVSVQADVSKVSEIDRLFQEGKKAFGKINIVMSNSGTESFDKTEEVTEEHFDYVFGLNTRAQFFVGQTAWKYLENNGRVILMASLAAGVLGVRDHALYNASKCAVTGLARSFATDFGVRGITVNAIAPGGVLSDMFTDNACKSNGLFPPRIWFVTNIRSGRYIPGGDASWPREKVEQLSAGHCALGRCAQPQDIARVVSFLASDDGGWVNGKCKAAVSG